MEKGNLFLNSLAVIPARIFGLQEVSKPFGTEIMIEGDIGVIRP